jgi:hypothetical protein
MNASDKAALDALEISPEILALYTKTEAIIRKAYGESPSAHELMLFWLTCATPELIIQEFEEAVLGTNASTLLPNEEGHYDEKSL